MRNGRENLVEFVAFAAASIAALITGLTVSACGGATRAATPSASASGGGAASSAQASAPDGGGSSTLSPAPSGLPPIAIMPPSGVAGSKKAQKKTTSGLFACGGGATATAKDPADKVKRLGESCAAVAKLTRASAMIRSQQGDQDAHQEHKLRVEAQKCYRVVFATEETVQDAVVMMRDSAGDVVGDSAGSALPDDGVLCFSTADEVTLMVAIGAGKGAYALQVWSD